MQHHEAFTGLADSYRNRLLQGLGSLPLHQISTFAKELVALRSRDGTLWIAGNGGSASTASHMQVDMGFGVSPGIRARALVDNSASITATGNDIGFASIFARQLALEARPGDLLLVISASGNSRDLLDAVEICKEMGIMTSAFTGFDGGVLKEIVDLAIVTPTAKKDYGVAEDMHAILNHMLKEILNGGFLPG